jgi:hypothetical protein
MAQPKISKNAFNEGQRRRGAAFFNEIRASSPFGTANGKLWRIVAIGNRKLRGKPTPTDLFARIAIKNRYGRLPSAGAAGLIHTLASSRYGSRKKALLERGCREPSG